MLDNLNNIKTIDKNNFFNSIKEFPIQIEEIFKMGNILQNKKNNHLDYDNILFCGMGGSAIGGDLFKSILGNKLKFPMIINRDYEFSSWVNTSTLVILSSYSGNTEEIISCYNQCIDKGIKPIIISSNGILFSILCSYIPFVPSYKQNLSISIKLYKCFGSSYLYNPSVNKSFRLVIKYGILYFSKNH